MPAASSSGESRNPDRKSTRLNSSHLGISYAVFCLKKKILVGDVDQLPPVGPGSVLKDLIECGLGRVGRWTEAFRQASGCQAVVTSHRFLFFMIPAPPQSSPSSLPRAAPA